jgi:hypothetical protein
MIFVLYDLTTMSLLPVSTEPCIIILSSLIIVFACASLLSSVIASGYVNIPAICLIWTLYLPRWWLIPAHDSCLFRTLFLWGWSMYYYKLYFIIEIPLDVNSIDYFDIYSDHHWQVTYIWKFRVCMAVANSSSALTLYPRASSSKTSRAIMFPASFLSLCKSPC